MRESERHALDRSLHEVMGGREPPDLTFRILHALRDAESPGKGSPTPDSTSTVAARGRWFWLGSVFGAAVAALAVSSLWIATQVPDTHGDGPHLDLRIRGGDLQWLHATRSSVFDDGTATRVFPALGDRIRPRGTSDTEFEIAGFGRVRLAAKTLVRIESMDLRQFGMGFGAGTVTIGVLAGAVTYWSPSSTVAAEAGETVELRESAEDLEARLANALQRIDQLENEPSRQPLPQEHKASKDTKDPVANAEKDAPTETSKFEPLETYPGFAEMNAAINWVAVGKGTVELMQLMQRRAELLAKGEEIPVELQAQMDEVDGRLIQNASAMLDFDVPGMTPDSMCRHPIVMANWLNSVLSVQGVSMNADQRRDMEQLSKRYSSEDELRRSAYKEDTLALQRRVDELDLRDRFIADARGLLNAEQLDNVWSRTHSERAGVNLMSTDFAWEDSIRPVVAEDRTSLAQDTSRQLVFDLRIDAKHRAALDRAVTAWANSYPDDWWNRPMVAFDRNGVYETARLRDAAHRQMKLWEDILRTVPLTDKQRQALIKSVAIRVPFRKS